MHAVEDHNCCFVPQQPRGSQSEKKTVQVSVRVWRIYEHDVILTVQEPQCCLDRTAIDVSIRGKTRHLQVLSDYLATLPLLFHEVCPESAAAKGLDSQRSGSRKEVKDCVEVRCGALKHRESGLSCKAGRRPYPLVLSRSDLGSFRLATGYAHRRSMELMAFYYGGAPSLKSASV